MQKCNQFFFSRRSHTRDIVGVVLTLGDALYMKESKLDGLNFADARCFYSFNVMGCICKGLLSFLDQMHCHMDWIKKTNIHVHASKKMCPEISFP